MRHPDDNTFYYTSNKVRHTIILMGLKYQQTWRNLQILLCSAMMGTHLQAGSWIKWLIYKTYVAGVLAHTHVIDSLSHIYLEYLHWQVHTDSFLCARTGALAIKRCRTMRTDTYMWSSNTNYRILSFVWHLDTCGWWWDRHRDEHASVGPYFWRTGHQCAASRVHCIGRDWLHISDGRNNSRLCVPVEWPAFCVYIYKLGVYPRYPAWLRGRNQKVLGLLIRNI